MKSQQGTSKNRFLTILVALFLILVIARVSVEVPLVRSLLFSNGLSISEGAPVVAESSSISKLQNESISVKELYSEYDLEQFRVSGLSKKCVATEDTKSTTYIGFGFERAIDQAQTVNLLFRYSEGHVYAWSTSASVGAMRDIPTTPASRESRKIYDCVDSQMDKSFFDVPSNITFTSH